MTEPTTEPTTDAETYDQAAVFAAARDVGEGWRIAEVTLGAGQTAWNPLSTKGPIYGPKRVRYEIHASGVRFIEGPPG